MFRVRDIVSVMRLFDVFKLIISLPQRLHSIEKRLAALEESKITIGPVTYIPSFTTYECPAGGNHVYPSPWFGVNKPPCEKCGHSQLDTVIWTNDSMTVN